jgi:hypothetical protein
MNFKKLLKQIGAGAGLTVASALIIDMFRFDFQAHFIEAYFFLAASLGIGLRSTQLLLQDAKKEKAQKELELSKKIVHLISEKYGKTTLAELMMRMDMPLPELKAKLDELQKEGILGMEVSNSGEVLYTVSNLSSLEDRIYTHKLI